MATAEETEEILIRHVLLTGPPGIGKTSMVIRICEILQFNAIPIQGFYTEEVKDKSGERVGFDAVTLDGNRGPLARVSIYESYGGHCYQREYKVGKYSVDIPSFESVALPALKPMDIPDQPDSVYVMDEIGKMECFSLDFISSVSEVYCRDTAVTLSTIPLFKGRPISLVDKIKSREDVKLIYVNRDNRDTMIRPIVETLNFAYRAING